MRYYHNIPPVFDGHSKVLILGSFPSVKSREALFYYHHPQNRFWRVLSAVLGSPLPMTIGEKRDLLLRNGVALWDVISSCEIDGSSDVSITNALPNDLKLITDAADIKHIFTNGSAAHSLYNRLCRKITGIEAVKLPSSSPANAGYSLSMLISEWSAVSYALIE